MAPLSSVVICASSTGCRAVASASVHSAAAAPCGYVTVGVRGSRVRRVHVMSVCAAAATRGWWSDLTRVATYRIISRYQALRLREILIRLF